jgi:hypothetical protein
MKTFRKLPIACLCILLIASGCETYISVYSDYDKTVNFNKYKTFAWLPDRDSTSTEYNNQIVRNNTRNYVNMELAERGYRLNIDSPDVFLDLVVRNVKTETTTAVTQPTYTPGWYTCNPYYQYCPPQYYYSYPYYNNYSTNYVTESSVDGSITVNMIDRRQNKMVWTATATGNLYDPEYMEDNLHPAVFSIIEKYPVKTVYKPSPSGQ